MTENQFIYELEKALNRLPASERTDILLDIRECFLNGRGDGKTESAIAASLGNPARIAEDLLASYSFIENDIQPVISNDLITIPNSSFSNVDINVQHCALFVRPSNDETTTVELIGGHEKLNLSAKVIGDTLFIRLKNLRHWLFMFNYNMKVVTLNVFIPKKVYQSFVMKSDNGRIELADIGGEIIGITDNGSFVIESRNKPTNATIHAKTRNGKIDVYGEQNSRTIFSAGGRTIRLKSGNGRVTVK